MFTVEKISSQAKFKLQIARSVGLHLAVPALISKIRKSTSSSSDLEVQVLRL